MFKEMLPTGRKSYHVFKSYPFQLELGNNSEIETRRFPGDGN